MSPYHLEELNPVKEHSEQFEEIVEEEAQRRAQNLGAHSDEAQHLHLDFYGDEMLSSSEPFLLKGESLYEEEDTPKFHDANLAHAASMPIKPKAPWHVLADTSSEEEEKAQES